MKDEIQKKLSKEKLEEEINKLDIEVIPTPKIDNIKADITFKIIVVGNSNVGKASLCLQGTTGKFGDSYIATVSFDICSFFAKMDNKLIRLQIWDTCGEEGYSSFQNFYRGTSLAILVYSVNDRRSFNDIGKWVKQFKAYSSPYSQMFLVGNNIHLERKISEEEGRKLSNDLGFFCFFEASAKTGFNCKEIFIKAIKLLYYNYINNISPKTLHDTSKDKENNKKSLILKFPKLSKYLSN